MQPCLPLRCPLQVMGCGEVSCLHERNPADNHLDPLFSPTGDKIGKWRRPRGEGRIGEWQSAIFKTGDLLNIISKSCFRTLQFCILHFAMAFKFRHMYNCTGCPGKLITTSLYLFSIDFYCFGNDRSRGIRWIFGTSCISMRLITFIDTIGRPISCGLI